MKSKILSSKERGITLVALVVTIIIMLILAGVALRLALGENGLFKMSEKAVEKYKEEAGKEENALQKGSEEIGNIIEELNRIDWGQEVASKLKEYQGKYVDIGLDTNGNEVTTDDWKIFYAGNDRIYLIAADCVPTSILEDDWKVIGSETVLGKAGFKGFSGCNCGWSSPQFLDLPEMPSNYLDIVMLKGYDLTAHKDNNNSKVVSQLLNKDAWNVIKEAAEKKDCIDFVIGGPTAQMWCAAWNEAIKEDENGYAALTSNDTNDYGYYVSSDKDGMKMQTNLYVTGSNDSLGLSGLMKLSRLYKTFFPHGGTSSDDCNGYWLASPSAANSSCLLVSDWSGGELGSWAYTERLRRASINLSTVWSPINRDIKGFGYL